MPHALSPTFPIEKGDAVAAEHAVVARWVEDAVGLAGHQATYQGIELKKLPSGKRIADAKGDEACQYVLAAVLQAIFWEQQGRQVYAEAKAKQQAVPADESLRIWGRRKQAETVARSLLKRKLPLSRHHLVTLLNWCCESEDTCPSRHPLLYIVRAIDHFVESQVVDPELRGIIERFATKLSLSNETIVSQMGTALLATHAGEPSDVVCVLPVAGTQFRPTPAWAGQPRVLMMLKDYFGMTGNLTLPATTHETIGLDQFPLDAESPLRDAHQLLSQVIEENLERRSYHQSPLDRGQAGRTLLKSSPELLGRAVLAAAERQLHALRSLGGAELPASDARFSALGLTTWLMDLPFSLPRENWIDLLLFCSIQPAHNPAVLQKVIDRGLQTLEEGQARSSLTEGERYVLSVLRCSMIDRAPLGKSLPRILPLTHLIGDAEAFYLEPGEWWTDAVNSDLQTMQLAHRTAWANLLTHLLTAIASRPTAKWVKTAQTLADGVGHASIVQSLSSWLPLVAQGRSRSRWLAHELSASGRSMSDESATCLRGFLWLIPHLDHGDRLLREISLVVLSAYKKIPGVGPRAVKVGNAGVYALSQLGSREAVGQLAMLKVRVKFGTAQKEIEKAFMASAESLGLTRDEVEEMGVPTYGLEEVGRRAEQLGEYLALLTVSGSSAQLSWFDAKQKLLKSVPAKVRSEFGEEYKELQQSLKDIQAMLPAQRDRLDSAFLSQKSWPIEIWRERYLQHPLVGTLVSRLIWSLDDHPVLFLEGEPTDVRGERVSHGKTADVKLWHPVGHSVEQITAWRHRLETLGVTQPFKQAHRELYLLTDAERRTNTYSNRFAAHILRQHQFHALCAARGWKNRLRLMVDDVYPPASKTLPEWGLRAEFWVEAAGDETNESGVYLRLASDQVRFYRDDAAIHLAHASGGGYQGDRLGRASDEPLALDQIPALVFSEIMRDVDLFVGVASVGNDPAWQDGGPEGRYRDYWQRYSFGDLSGTATTRKEVLERLVPRLKIANQCRLSDRFLVVQGKKRAYKIHLGSGNILMEPNDQYLCIVPDSRARQEDHLFLPFEGDQMLSIILSKAFLLAEDVKIKDPTIVRQIDQG